MNMATRTFLSNCVKWANFSKGVYYFQRYLSVKVGERLPSVDVYEYSPDNPLNISELFKGKKGILFAVPGAYVPGCTQGHIPEYLHVYDRFVESGYSVLACICVNDPFVINAWAKEFSTLDKVRMLSDMKCEFTKAIGMELDCTEFLGNFRSKRYSMLVHDGVIQHISTEPYDTGLACLLCIDKMKWGDRDSEDKLTVVKSKKTKT